MFRDIASCRICLLNCNRISMFGRAVMIDEYNRCFCPYCQLPHEAIMRHYVTKHPAATVEVQDGRSVVWCTYRTNETKAKRSCLGIHIPILDLSIQFLNRTRLDPQESIARLLRRQLIDGWFSMCCEALDDFSNSGVQHKGFLHLRLPFVLRRLVEEFQTLCGHLLHGFDNYRQNLVRDDFLWMLRQSLLQPPPPGNS